MSSARMRKYALVPCNTHTQNQCLHTMTRHQTHRMWPLLKIYSRIARTRPLDVTFCTLLHAKLAASLKNTHDALGVSTIMHII